MRFLIILLFLIIIAACGSNKKQDAGMIIPQKKMELVIYDMMLVDRYAMQFMVNDSIKKNNLKWESMKLFNQVLLFHNVSKKQFFASFDYYMKRPEEFTIMIDSLVSISNKGKEELYKNTMR